MHVDLPLDDLWRFVPDVEEPDDFDAFWSGQLDEARAQDVDPVFDPVETGLATVDVSDVVFTGHGGTRIRGWFILPRHCREPLPTIVEYIGYGGGRGFPHEWLAWSAAGYAHLVMDTRGQGSSWRGGDTADLGDTGGPAAPGFLTRGITDPRTYYYVRLFVDAVRAVEAARAHPAVDPDRVAVVGVSQGGALALAAAHLSDRPVAVMADVPFLANIPRAVTITDEDPYAELARWCRIHHDRVDQAFRTLSYVDVVSHARRATVPALFSVALADEICPPSTVFSAYNVYKGQNKDIRVYRFDGHEGGGAYHAREKLDFARQHLHRS